MFKGSFTDGNNEKVVAGNEVEYRFGARRGELVDALQDGDGYVFFYDTAQHEMVKWKNLCKVPVEYKTNNPPKPYISTTITFKTYDWYIV